ncbi:OsmC family protein [Paractinoplanes globisporus]|uniref:OsmC family protein n=1 Tax=Paractinoplanes globisporus TaxID=113565 RepID=A0ABW6WTB1_9ACTN|nr:OsmC family protein [Actinoplanes globisporus]
MSINGVDTKTLFATIDAVKGQPELAKFQFRASNRWVNGTHNRTTVNGYYGTGQEFTRDADHHYDADHPPVLTGSDQGPTPVEFLLHALAACLTSGLANIAAARGIGLTEVTSTVEGDIDLRGILGLDPTVRNGFDAIRISFAVRGEGTPEQLQGLVEQARARSAVFDMLTNPVRVSVEAKAV